MGREQYQEHCEREEQGIPFAVYHLKNKPDKVLFPLHWHRETEWILPEAAGMLELEGEIFPYEPGDLLCVNSGQLHFARGRTAGPVQLVVFDLRMLISPLMELNPRLPVNRIAGGELLFPGRIRAEEPVCFRLREKLGRVGELWQTGGREAEMQLLFMEILRLYEETGLLTEKAPGRNGSHSSCIKESVRYMRMNYGESLSIEELAAALNLSPSHYMRLFRQYTGETPVQFLNRIRMEKAAGLLREGMGVTETAMQTGVTNLSYFIRLFRRQYGVTPGKFRKNP